MVKGPRGVMSKTISAVHNALLVSGRVVGLLLGSVTGVVPHETPTKSAATPVNEVPHHHDPYCPRLQDGFL